MFSERFVYVGIRQEQGIRLKYHGRGFTLFFFSKKVNIIRKIVFEKKTFFDFFFEKHRNLHFLKFGFQKKIEDFCENIFHFYFRNVFSSRKKYILWRDFFKVYLLCQENQPEAVSARFQEFKVVKPSQNKKYVEKVI